MRVARAESGFSLIEVMYAMAIVAIAIGGLQTVANGALKTAVETNRLRIAKMLLRELTENVANGLLEAGGAELEEYPGFAYEVVTEEVAVGEGEQPEAVVQATITVTYPTLLRTDDGGGDFAEPERAGDVRDAPGTLRATILIDPPEAELKPAPPEAGAPGGGGGSGGGGNP